MTEPFARVALAALLCTLAAPSPAPAQATVEVTGTVRSTGGQPLAGATVEAAGLAIATVTGADGTFHLAVGSGVVTIRVSHPEHASSTRVVTVAAGGTALEFVLQPLPRYSELVTVQAVRATPETPVTRTDLARAELESRSYGQEMPFLLKQVPAVTQYSDGGAGAGYSYLSLRGVPQTRMNLTLDGAPLNEPEDSAFYFANFGDFAGSLEAVQVQRGVGTSAPGAASFVGAINFASVDFKAAREASARVTAGAFGTAQVSAGAHSGTLGNGLRLYGRVAYQATDGFREHAGVIQRAAYFGASRQGDRSFFKVFGFAGHENSQLAFLAADADTLARNLRANPLTPEERDSFGQRFVQGQYHRALGPGTDLAVQGYYNGAGGWYRIRGAAAAPSGIYQYGLDWRLAGTTATLKHVRSRLTLTWGAHANDFESTHRREVVDGAPEYANHGHRNEASTFARLGVDAGRWHHFGDAQVRWTRFGYEGDQPIGSVSWVFVNPKLGTRYDLAAGFSAYASVGHASREPARSDLFAGEDNPSVLYDLEAVSPERVVNLEAGVEYRRPGLDAHVNLYDMEFRDEIALTGELSEVGLPLRRNVDRSYRRGVELDVTWQPLPALRVVHTAHAGRARIREWTQFYDVYDASGGWTGTTHRLHHDVTPLGSPAYVGNLAVDYAATGWLSVGAAGRYVSKIYLDNTRSEELTAPGYFNLDATVSLSLRRLVGAGDPRLRVQMNNVLDNRRMFASGYSYQYFVHDGVDGPTPVGVPYYYPLATRSLLVTLDLRM